MQHTEILNYFLLEELYNSSLLLSEHLYLDTSNENYLFYILKSLQKLNYDSRVIAIVKNNEKLLAVEEIHKIFLVSLGKTRENNNLELKPTLSLGIDLSQFSSLNKSSLSNLLISLTQKEEMRRNSLLKSFKYDERNLEALFYIKSEKLISKEELKKLVLSIGDIKWREICYSLFLTGNKHPEIDKKRYGVIDEYLIFSPYRAYKLALSLYERCEDHEMFKLAVFMLEYYANSYLSALILGLFYLKRGKYKDAKKSFYESIEKDGTQGRSYFYLGLTLSLLKERINAVTCFKKARELMIGSYKPLFFLAKEFSEINDNVSALFYYKHTIKMKLNKNVFFSYVSFLFKEERLKEMAKVMSALSNFDLNKKERNIYNILTFFYLLSRGKFEDAEGIIKSCDMDWRYYICYGYLKHLMAKNDDAISFYSECMLDCNENTNVITELIKLAYNGGTQLYEHDLVDYSVDVFDMLKIGANNEVSI